MGFSIGRVADPAAARDDVVAGATVGAAGAAAMRDSRSMEPTTFERPEDFRRWLEQHHDSEQELWVGYFKKTSGKPSMTWPESVDVAQPEP
jgi:hypothetical protein